MEAVLEELRAAWARSDRLFSMLEPADLYDKGIPLRHPFVFYVGHLPSFAWNHLAAVVGAEPFDARLDALFARGIDPEDEAAASQHDREVWPDLESVYAYRDGVRKALPSLVARLAERARQDPYARDVLPMVLEHEQMHHETLLYMLHRVGPERLARPTGWPLDVAGPAMSPRSRVVVGGGPVRLGAAREVGRFGWDNEFPEHVEVVSDFAIDRVPVTVGEWREFVEGGGYHSDGPWEPADRTWRDAVGLEHPDTWRRGEAGWRVRSLFQWHDLDAVSGWPVHVSLAEARAWCRWKGDCRLPTESELHRAAFTAPDGSERDLPWGSEEVGPERAAASYAFGSPVPVGSLPGGRSAWGVDELVGNGWEWTSTPFMPRDGFEPHLRTYSGYSADFFDGLHFVVFGASWATDRRLVRRSFRNWYQHHYPYVFATFRTVAL